MIQLKSQTDCVSEVITASPHETALAALIRMKQKGIHHLPVVSDDCLVGIVSDRDLMTRALSIGMADQLSWVSVGDAMRRDPPVISATTEIGEVLKLMFTGGYSGMPVVEAGALRGVVTESDILRFTAKILEDNVVVVPGMQYLANPLAQKLMSLLAALGI